MDSCVVRRFPAETRDLLARVASSHESVLRDALLVIRSKQQATSGSTE